MASENLRNLWRMIFWSGCRIVIAEDGFSSSQTSSAQHISGVLLDISSGASGILVALVLITSLKNGSDDPGLSQLPMSRTETETTIMRTYLTCLFASLLFLASISMPVAAQQSTSAGTTVDRIKAKVAKLGVGEKAKATVYLKDGTKKKGYIGQAGSDDFVLRDRKTDAPTTISYSDVSKVDSNRGHSTARNLAIGIGIGAGALLAIIFITIAHLD